MVSQNTLIFASVLFLITPNNSYVGCKLNKNSTAKIRIINQLTLYILRKMEKKVNYGPVATQIKALEVGEVVHFPVVKLVTVKTCASNVGLAMGRKFTTSVDREQGVISVTRAE